MGNQKRKKTLNPIGSTKRYMDTHCPNCIVQMVPQKKSDIHGILECKIKRWFLVCPVCGYMVKAKQYWNRMVGSHAPEILELPKEMRKKKNES